MPSKAWPSYGFANGLTHQSIFPDYDPWWENVMDRILVDLLEDIGEILPGVRVQVSAIDFFKTVDQLQAEYRQEFLHWQEVKDRQTDFNRRQLFDGQLQVINRYSEYCRAIVDLWKANRRAFDETNILYFLGQEPPRPSLSG